MRPKHEIESHIRAFMALELNKLKLKTKDQLSKLPNGGSAIAKVASVIAIRSIMDAFVDLQPVLTAICQYNQIKPYYQFRKILTERVMNDSLQAYEFCRETLERAVQSPMVTKLTEIAALSYSLIEKIRLRVGLAMDYYEIKHQVIKDIFQFTSAPTLTDSQLQALKFSVDFALPLKLEEFSSTAREEFSDEVHELNQLCISTITSVKLRVDELQQIESPKKEEPETPTPCRSVRVIRGMKCKQKLNSNYHGVVPLPTISEYRSKDGKENGSEYGKEHRSEEHRSEEHRSEEHRSNNSTHSTKAKDQIIVRKKTHNKPHNKPPPEENPDVLKELPDNKTRMQQPTKLVNRRASSLNLTTQVKSLQTKEEQRVKPKQSLAAMNSRIVHPTVTPEPSGSRQCTTPWQASVETPKNRTLNRRCKETNIQRAMLI